MAIIDYTSPVLCTPITPFLAMGDAAYRQLAGGGPSHGHRKHAQLECRPMPNLMAALPNIGGALCSTPQSLADAHY